MAWGIPGNVGEIFRKQQSDELKDQLLQQTLAQRIKEFDQEQQQKREEAAALAEDRKAQREYQQAVLARQGRLDTATEEKTAGQNRAISNIQQLIPLLQPGTPEFRTEAAMQGLRFAPQDALSELTKEPKITEAERLRNLQQERDIIESTQAKYATPPTPPRPQYMEVPDVDEKGNAVTRVMTAEQAAGRTFRRTVPTKPPTGLQNTALGYYKRMDEAIKTMDDVESKVSAKDLYLINNSPLPNLINNPLLSEAGQIYAQALGTYTEARLRKESGAAIAAHEFAQDRQTIGRQVGDTPKTLEKKQQTRKTTARGLAIAAGPAYEQEFGEPLEKLGTGGQSTAPDAVVNALKSKGAGRYTLSDGSVWEKQANGSVTKAQ